MENNNYIERIHRFLSNTMTEPERSAFEADMANDKQLAEDLVLEKKLLSGIHLAGDDALRNSISNAQRRLSEQRFFNQAKVVSINSAKSTKSFIMRKVMSIAAAAIVLIGLVWWGFFRQSVPNTEQVFADNFKPEVTNSKAIAASLEAQGLVGEPTVADSLRQALVMYNDGKYNEAMAAFDSILVHHPANDTAQFYLAMSHLNESRYARAVEILEPLTNSDTSPFKLDAMWYLGLCYFKVDGGLPKAEDIFNQLASNAEFKDQKAAKGILHLLGH